MVPCPPWCVAVLLGQCVSLARGRGDYAQLGGPDPLALAASAVAPTAPEGAFSLGAGSLAGRGSGAEAREEAVILSDAGASEAFEPAEFAPLPPKFQLAARQPSPDFPVAIKSRPRVKGNGSTVSLRLRGNWNPANHTDGPRPCVAVVERPEHCNASVLQDGGECEAEVLWEKSDLNEFLGFKVKRPGFTISDHLLLEEHNHSVCLWGARPSNDTDLTLEAPVIVGRLEYYPSPRVQFDQKVDKITVRTFLNPGWRKLITVECRNCTYLNRVTVEEFEPVKDCQLQPGGVAAAVAAIHARYMSHMYRSSRFRYHRRPGAHVPLPAVPPTTPLPLPLPGSPCLPNAASLCRGYVEQAMDSASLVEASGSQHIFLLEGSERLPAVERRRLFHRRSALCFYPDEASPKGTLIGYVEFHMDGYDLQAFVGFVCFFGIALPLICMITVLMHVSKQQQCKQHVQEIRLQVQREQLAREMEGR